MQHTSRRDFMKTVGIGAAAMALPGPFAACQSNRFSRGGKRPNFLFLFTDDQTFKSIGALNNHEIRTPNIDQLAKEGVRDSHAFTTAGVCAPFCRRSP